MLFIWSFYERRIRGLDSEALPLTIDKLRRKRYEFLEHTADEYIAAYGATLEKAFENAALAMFEVMTDTAQVRPNEKDPIEAKGKDELELLFSWLEMLLKKFEIDGKVYSQFKVNSIEKGAEGHFLLGEARGEPFDPARHPSRSEIKAVTYHRMVIRRNAEGVTVEFILDI